MENLGELNKLYNFQSTVILCKIFESRASFLSKKIKFNPRKCNSASSFSGCVQRNKSKCCIPLPTSSEIAKLFQKTLICGFSGVNTRLAFEWQILLPKNRRERFKLIYDLKINSKKESKRIVTKILKWTKTTTMEMHWQNLYQMGVSKNDKKFLAL